MMSIDPQHSNPRPAYYKLIYIIVWKNFLWAVRKPKELILFLVVPLAIVALSVYLRSSYKQKIETDKIYSDYPVESIADDTHSDYQVRMYGYTPKTMNETMNRFDKLLKMPDSTGFDNEADLVAFIRKAPIGTRAGLVFRFDKTRNVNVVTIRLYTKNRWGVETLWGIPRIGIRKRLDKTGSYLAPGYYSRGFVMIQNAVFRAFYPSLKFNQTIHIARMPVKASTDDAFVELIFSVIIVYIFVFCYSLSGSISAIVEEKQTALKELMFIMGLPSWVNWLGFLIVFVLQNGIYIIIATFLWIFPIGSPVACFERTNGLLLFTILLLHALSLGGLAMLISSFLRNVNQVNMISIILFSAMTFPIVLSDDFRDYTGPVNAAVLLLPPSTLGIALRTAFVFEDMGLGMQWSYLLMEPGGSAFPMAILMIAMAVQTVVYMILALYFEQILPGEFGTPRNWYYPFEIFLPKPVVIIDASQRDHKCTQEPDMDAITGIEVVQLTKAFRNNFVAVKSLTMTIYKSSITVLLGENGAGKSTAISLLTGMTSPTSGTAIFKHKLDLRRDLNEIRHLIGFCPQKNILFRLLTVQEHLIFYGMLKGLSWQEAKVDSYKFLLDSDLEDKAGSLVGTLSGGQQRKLCLGNALAGGSKVVFLDEPTSGVDPLSRRDMWRILQGTKKGKSILLSTHFMDEADVLGDRVAIMHHGELKCMGTSTYLKEKFESAYSLTCAFQANANVDQVTREILSIVPDARIRHRYESEISFELSPKWQRSFESLFRRLELVAASIGIDSFGIELPGLEDVFIKTTHGGSEMGEVKLLRPKLKIGVELLMVQVWAIFKKRIYYNYRNPLLFLTELIIPVALLLYYHLRMRDELHEEKALRLALSEYDQQRRICLVESEKNVNRSLIDSYWRVVSTECEVTQVRTIEDYILNATAVETYNLLRHTMIGVKFKADKIVAAFNNQPLHSLPMAVTSVYNAVIAWKYGGSASTLEFVSYPIPSETIAVMQIIAVVVAVTAMFFLSLWLGLFGFFYIEERTSAALNLQFINGLPGAWYWFWSYVHDLLVVGVATAFVLLAEFCFAGPTAALADIFLTILSFSIGTLPLIYFMSKKMQNTASFSKLIILFAILAVVLYVVLQTLQAKSMLKPGHERFFMVVPYLNFIILVNRYTAEGERNLVWENHVIFLGVGLFLLTILILDDMHLFYWLKIYKFGRVPFVEEELDGEVKDEMDRVDAMSSAKIADHLLVAKHLRKFYRRTTAVKDVSFAMNVGECLGLLGKNGAGKTTLFQMLTGKVPISEGEAWILGVSIKNQLLKTFKLFGYCPQIDPILEDLTASNWLEIICLIRGVPRQDIDRVSKKLATLLGFEMVLDNTVRTMSGGNKRKLCTALALIGSPEVVYLDEPTTGMDPNAKRRVWNVLSACREQGHSIVLSTHSMDECEALCTRMIILMDGKMMAIATSYHLKQKYSTMGLLVINIEKLYAMDRGNVARLKTTLRDKLKGFGVKQEYQGKIECEFDITEKLSKLYGLMQSIKATYHIEGYAVSNQNSLVNIFLDSLGQ